MNRTRLLMIGFVALALGAVVSFAVYRTLQSRSGGDAPPGVDVVVAANDIAVGAKVEDRDVRTVRFPAADLPPNSFHLKSSVVGRGAVLPIAKGEFFLPNKLAGENAGSGMPSLIPPGMRAVSVRVNEVIGVAGFVVPGTRVDVLLTGNPTRRRRRANYDGPGKRSGYCYRPEAGKKYRWRTSADAGNHFAGFSRRRSEAHARQYPGKDSTGAAQPLGHQTAGARVSRYRGFVSRCSRCGGTQRPAAEIR